MKTSLIGLCVGLVLGLLAGYVIFDPDEKPDPVAGGSDSKGDPPTETNTPTVSKAVPVPDSPSVDKIEIAARPSTPAPVETIESSSAERLLEIAAKKLAPPPPPTGDGVITGKAILRDEGTPVEGVLIVATAVARESADHVTDYATPIKPAPFDGTRPFRPRPGVKPELRAKWEMHAAVRRASREYRTETGPDGTFTLSGLPGSDGAWTFEIAPWWEHGDAKLARDTTGPGVSLKFQDFKPGDHIEILVTREYEVEFEVRMPDGSPGDGAMVWCSGPKGWPNHGTSGSKWYSEARTQKLVSGTYNVSAELERMPPRRGYADKFSIRSSSEEIVVGPGSPSGKIVLRLLDQPGARIIVRDPVGYDRHFEIAIVHLEAGQIPPASARRQMSKSREEAGKNLWLADFPWIDVGTYAAAVIESDEVVVSKPLVVSTGVAVVELELPPPPRKDYAVVWVYGPGGELLDNVSFRAVANFTRGSVSASGPTSARNAWRRDDGAWCVFHPSFNVKAMTDFDANVTVYAQSSKYGVGEATHQYGEAPECTIRFRAPGKLIVQLRNVKGHTHIARMHVSVGSTRSSVEGRSFSYDLSYSGEVPESLTFDDLYTDEYRVLLQVKWSELFYVPPLTLDEALATITGDTVTVTLTAPALYDFELQLPGLSREHEVAVTLNDPRDGMEVSAKCPVGDGKLKYPGFPAGRYTVTIRASADSYEFVPMTFSLPSTGPWVYDAKPYDALLVSEVDTSSAAYTSGLRRGDLVIGVNRRTDIGPSEMRRRFTAEDESDDGTITLSLLRQGRAMDVTMSRHVWAGCVGAGEVSLESARR